MKFRIQSCWPNIVRRWLLLLTCLAFSLGFSSSLPWLAQAEGSRTLYPEGIAGHRANLEWRNSLYGSFLTRRTLLKVYVEEGEVILLGSSAMGVLDGAGNLADGDIRIFNPGQVTGPVGQENIPDPADFSCRDQAAAFNSPDHGRIASREQELAGPDTIADPTTGGRGNAIPTGFVPCFYPVNETGVYHVVFYGPEGGDSNTEIAPTGQVDLANPANFDEQQSTSVAAWDVTVRSALDSTDDINGRLFADYITQFTGANPRPVYSNLFIVTGEGYVYEVDLRGLDPNGFILYANDVGFRDQAGHPLYHDVMARPDLSKDQRNQLNELVGDTQLAPPTHQIFFSEPAEEVLEAINIPTDPVIPRLDAFEFEGPLGENDSFIGGGGVFNYSSNVGGTYQLIISRDGVNFDLDNPLNRYLEDQHLPGEQTIPWDGLDNEGNPFQPGTYQARMVVRAGENHFPILDAEASEEGGPSLIMTNPPNGNCPSFEGEPASCTTGFYDDRGYQTIDADGNLVSVGTPGQVLPGVTPPQPPNSNLLTGFNTTSPQRSFGSGQSDGFGDEKGLDLWTYFPSEARLTTIDIIQPNVAIDKTDGGIRTSPGGQVIYTLTYSNTTPLAVSGVVISETVPLHTTFSQAGSSAPNGWSCPDGSPEHTLCITEIGPLAGNASGSVSFGLIVSQDVPETVTQIDNVVMIGEDGSNGPEQTRVDNVASDDTPLGPVQDLNLVIAKTDGGVTTKPGGVVQFNLSYLNEGPLNATGVTISETVPEHTTFNAAGSSAGWSCPDGSPASATCLFSVGVLDSGGSGSVNFAVKVSTDLPESITRIFNTARIADDGAQGPERTLADNVASDDTPLERDEDECPTCDDDNDKDTPTPTRPPSSGQEVSTPTPTIPVLFLPETGQLEQSSSGYGLLPVIVVLMCGLLWLTARLPGK